MNKASGKRGGFGVKAWGSWGVDLRVGASLSVKPLQNPAFNSCALDGRTALGPVDMLLSGLGVHPPVTFVDRETWAKTGPPSLVAEKAASSLAVVRVGERTDFVVIARGARPCKGRRLYQHEALRVPRALLFVA